MSDSLQITSVQLRVANLARSVEFYTRQLGFVQQSSATATKATLAVTSDAAPLLTLTEDRSAPPPPRDAAGLFHAAMLLPSRAALGRWLHQAAANQTPLEGFGDHGVSEAIYLSDPDGNGLEFYADRPRDAWPRRDGELAMGTETVDVRSLLAAGTAAAHGPVLAGAHWGHLHLRVSDLARAERFYTEALDLTLMQRFGPSARFLAADGYHHHLGLNTWGGVRQPQPAGALGLMSATLRAAGATHSQTLRDPDGITLVVEPGAVRGSS